MNCQHYQFKVVAERLVSLLALSSYISWMLSVLVLHSAVCAGGNWLSYCQVISWNRQLLKAWCGSASEDAISMLNYTL
jgi:hypothetical protein